MGNISNIITMVMVFASIASGIGFWLVYRKQSGAGVNISIGKFDLNPNAGENVRDIKKEEVERSKLQEYLEIEDIENSIIKLKRGNGLRIILSISSPDFALLNDDEKNIFENSLVELGLALNFSIQFFTTSTKVDTKVSAEKALAVTKDIDDAIDQKLKDYSLSLYERLLELENSRHVYVRKSYCVIGIDGVVDKKRALSELRNRVGTVMGALSMAKMRVNVLEKEKIAQLFANVLNKGSNISIEHMLENDVFSTYSVGEKLENSNK
ncbi:MAG: hypothetical protein A2Y24_02995 [Clostridiales bacterium GWE2_32_10]|nr:MAG: hypothetical protein A2Y24_02995 [Clostridiales bacterium GWE2_32_10]HBY20587.1 hypothetical protein [Clostridiales bacterium]